MFRNLVFIIFLSALFSCNSSTQPVTREEATAFAKKMVQDVHKNRIGFISENIVVPVFLERVKATPGIHYTDALEKELVNYISKRNIESRFTTILSPNGNFDLVRVYEKDGQQRAIFRAYDGSLNYIDMELVKLAGKTGIADFFVYRTGSWFSMSWAGTIATLMHEKRHDDFALINNRVNEVQQLVAAEDFVAAKAVFESLPGYLQTTKAHEVTYLIILSALKDRAYLREIEAFELKYEEDPYTAINYIDLHFFNKDYYAALECVNTVDSLVGGDAFTDFYRGLIYNTMGEPKKASSHLEQLVSKVPLFADGYLELFASYNTTGEAEKAKANFNQYAGMPAADSMVVAYYKAEYPYLAD